MLEVILIAEVVVIIIAFLPKVDLLIDRVSNFFMGIAVLALIGLSFLVFYEVMARKFFYGGSIAMQELEWHLFDIVFLFSIAYTLMHDKHVRVDILYQKFSIKKKALIQLISIFLFVVPLSALIAYSGAMFAYEAYKIDEISPDPGGLCCRWIIKSALAIGFLLVIFQSGVEVKKALYKLKKG